MLSFMLVLGLVAAVFFLFFLFLPLQLVLQSLYNLITVPTQLVQIVFNRQLRRNHALEHATINVIEELYGPLALSGMAHTDGFLIRGAPYQLVEQAARLGLTRLQRGERQLAIHRRCGTSVATANFVLSAAFLAVLFVLKQVSLVKALLVIVLAMLLGSPLGQWVQRLTTAADLSRTEILGVEYRPRAWSLFGLTLGYGSFDLFVRTRQRPAWHEGEAM